MISLCGAILHCEKAAHCRSKWMVPTEEFLTALFYFIFCHSPGFHRILLINIVGNELAWELLGACL